MPVLFDPLISAWDKQVYERGKRGENSAASQALLAWEKRLLEGADLVLADTVPHADFFTAHFGLPQKKLAVVGVGAEEGLFQPAPPDRTHQGPVEALFFGSFIGLQGPRVIVEAARCYEGPPVSWHMLGAGPLLRECRKVAKGLDNVIFEPWLDYARLPARIQDADILLGVFGGSEKASRVIPNKVYQALTCGRPVITRESPAYPDDLDRPDSGIRFIPAADPEALAASVADWASRRQQLAGLSASAFATYKCHFSNAAIGAQLAEALRRMGFTD